MWNEDIYNNEVVSIRRMFKEDLDRDPQLVLATIRDFEDLASKCKNEIPQDIKTLITKYRLYAAKSHT
jgi:hypothetical protein